MASPRRKRAAGGRLPIFAIAFACLVIAVVYANRSPGTYQDDDVDRYYLSRQVWKDPSLLLDRWGMPLPVAAFSAPAKLFGYGGVEGTTALVTAFAAAAIGFAAQAAGFGFPWVAALLFFFQPLVLELSFSGLAEPFAAALVAAALWAWYSRRRGRAVWLAGLLPLARIDAGVLTVLVLIAAWRSDSMARSRGGGGADAALERDRLRAHRRSALHSRHRGQEAALEPRPRSIPAPRDRGVRSGRALLLHVGTGGVAHARARRGRRRRCARRGCRRGGEAGR